MGVDAEHGALVVRIAAEDYESLKAFFAGVSNIVLPRLDSLPAEKHPLAVLERFESGSMARAREGLAHAIGDIVEVTEAFSAGQVAEIDAALAAAGLLTLSAVRVRFGRAVRAIMKRGRVRSEREYYALRNVVDAMAEPEQAEAWGLLAAYEERIVEARA